MLGPLVFQPYLRERIWGGTRLRDRLGRSLPDDRPYGESWELSALPEHDSVVAEGPHRGAKLSELWRNHRQELLGNAPDPYGGQRFPLLIKWLDCQALLSVQVHPDDAGAQRLIGEPCGKAEAWVFLEAADDAEAYFGVKSGTSPREFERRMTEGTVEAALQTIQPRAGDVIYVPPGSVHALGPGQLLLEIEQPSDATFRVFDYNRPGPDGRPRELHKREALASIDWQRQTPPPLEPELWTGLPDAATGETLVRTPSFCVQRLTLTEPLANPFAGDLAAWTVFEGTGRLSWIGGERTVREGDTVLIPGSSPPASWHPEGDRLVLIGATLR